jgi:hypothetical protein
MKYLRQFKISNFNISTVNFKKGKDTTNEGEKVNSQSLIKANQNIKKLAKAYNERH